MNQKMAIGGLTAVNLVIATFFGFAYFAFTANTVVQYQPGTTIVSTEHGLHGGIYRYLFCVVAGLFLEAVMFIFNISVVDYLVEDREQGKKYCVAIGIASLLLLVGIAAVEVALNIA